MHFKILSRLFLILLCVLAVMPLQAQTNPENFPTVVARVNGHEISGAELLTQAQILRGQAQRGGNPDPAAAPDFYRSVLEGLISEVLVYDDLKKRGEGVNASEIDEAISTMESNYPDAAAFDEALKQQDTDRKKLRQQLERSMTVEKAIRRDVESKVVVSEDRKRAFYDENKDRMIIPERRLVRHILRRVPPGASETEKDSVRERIEDIRRLITEGADFGTMAQEFSEDAVSRDNGGELPWAVMTGDTSSFYKAVVALELEKLSEVVETEAGFHILELVDMRPRRQRTFEEVEKNISDHLTNEAVFGEVQKKVTVLKETANVEIFI